MTYQNKKKNIYDFSVNLDDDYYTINGVSYKRVDIDIYNFNESFGNNSDLLSYIEQIKQKIGTDTVSRVDLNTATPNTVNEYLKYIEDVSRIDRTKWDGSPIDDPVDYAKAGTWQLNLNDLFISIKNIQDNIDNIYKNKLDNSKITTDDNKNIFSNNKIINDNNILITSYDPAVVTSPIAIAQNNINKCAKDSCKNTTLDSYNNQLITAWKNLNMAKLKKYNSQQIINNIYAKYID